MGFKKGEEKKIIIACFIIYDSKVIKCLLQILLDPLLKKSKRHNMRMSARQNLN